MAALLAPGGAPLSALLDEGAHSLSEQAYRPRMQHRGVVNVDGTGVVWWPEAGGEPLRYVTDKPPWADANLPHLAPRLCAVAQLAAVRSATPGLPFGPAATAPFLVDRVTLAHNGRVDGIGGPLGRELLARLPDDLYAQAGVLTDSVLLALTVAARLRERPADGLPGALAGAVLLVAGLAGAAGGEASLTMLACDGNEVHGVRAALGGPAPTLFSALRPGAALAASEPLDDQPDWTEVPDWHLVRLRPEGASLTPLEPAT